MAKIVAYDALASYAAGLKTGDLLTIGPDDVAPVMIDTLVALSLAASVTVVSATVTPTPAGTIVTGTADLFGLTRLDTRLTFRPQAEDALSGPFLLAIQTSPATGTEWQLLPDFVLSNMAIGFGPNDQIDVYTATIACDFIIGASRSLTLPIELDVAPYPDLDWTLTGNFAAQPLSADAFSALADGMVLSDYLPSGLDILADFGMTQLELAFNPTKTSVSYVFMNIAYTAAWSVLGIIDVPAGGVTLKFLADFRDSLESYVELEAQFSIATVPVDIGAHFAPDDFVVWGRLQEGKTLSISALFEHFGVTLPSGFPDITIDRMAMMAQLSLSTYSFDLITQIDAGSALKVNDLTVKTEVATKSDVNPETKVSAEFSATIVIDVGTTLFLGAQYDGDGSGVTLTGNATNIPIGTIIGYIASEFGIAEDQIPEPIRTLTLTALNTSYNTATGDFHFQCVGDFTIYDEPVEVMFRIDIIHPASPHAARLGAGAVQGSKGYSATFGGTVSFADNLFEIWFNVQDTGQLVFVADYQHQGGGDVKIHDLVASVSTELAQFVPNDIAINLKVVKFAYLKAPNPEQPAKPVNRFLFGVELGATIGLTDIPLIGDKLPADLTVEFEQLQFAYAQPDFSPDQAGIVNALFPVGVGKIPAEGLAEGVLISSILKLGDTSKTLSLTIPTGSPPPQDVAAIAPPVAFAPSGPDAPTPPAGMSINIQKQFGPLSIRKLGLAYEDQRLFATGDLSLTAEILSIGLLGLGIGSKVTAFDPAVKLSGLTIAVAQGPIDISGGLYGSIDPLDFDGALKVTLPSMSLGALGGYAQLGSDPSFFMYVSVNRPLFGYPFFFLDGIAGGLGFNRDLMIPDIDDVASFPLVAWAMGQSPPGANPNGDIGAQVEAVVAALRASIPPHVGQYWVAAGIKFSSFSILNSFALVTVVFGTDFKFALLGLTTASLPPDTGKNVEPIGYVEMALRVSFAPATGILQVEAKLTPSSYILSKDCVLTGGFAYYMWFKDNPAGDAGGYHAGDFVVTLGGYNSAYTVPAFYPNPPQLGFNWKVDGNTTIKGGVYFALTPSALMAGGALEAVWQSGDLRAWFTAHADFLLSWKPFHYQADIGLSIGASYKLDLLFTSVTISVHIGVELSLWGPSFGGSIYVDLTVISFTVRIGNQDRPAPQPISWTDFKTAFLPQNTALHAQALMPGATIETDSYCLSSVAAGLIKDLTAGKADPAAPDWIVNAEKLELVTMTAFPSKSASVTTAVDKTTALPAGKADFGVGPVAVAIADFASTHAITVNKLVAGKPDPGFDITDRASIELVSSNLPTATWGGKLVVNPSISEINTTPANIAALAVGYRIKARLQPPDHTPLPIDVALLQQENEGTEPFVWLTPTIPTTDSFDQAQAMAIFQATLTSAAPQRAALIAVLNGPQLDLGLDADVDITALAQSANTVLLHAPVLSYLGEEKQP